MAIPSKATKWTQPMDPADVVDYEADLSTLLETGEEIVSFLITLDDEAAAVGVGVRDLAPYAPVLIDGNTAIKLWFGVDAPQQGNAAFTGSGFVAGVKFTITTDSVPPRTRERTYSFKVMQL